MSIPSMSNPDEYTVGWICAVEREYVAAQVFLDEKYPPLTEQDANDNNVYTLGRVGGHRVVIACLPHWNYGLVSAATVARDMVRTFPNLRFGLMVGIGGGVPTRHDIRLGDVVVSSVDYDKGAVFQYDFGQKRQNREFRTTGYMDAPPLLLQSAVQACQAEYRLEGNHIDGTVSAVLERNLQLREEYKRPDPASDRLYRSDFEHQGLPEDDCASVCGTDEANIVPRPPRPDAGHASLVHYGLIASASTLMEDATTRDRLAREKDVLCFEMEAAGLMNHFKCPVIRGICDYCDTHRNWHWQGYAAMVASAYARDLLHHISPSNVKREKRLAEELSSLRDVAAEQRDIANDQLQDQRVLTRYLLSQKEEKVLQLFRLTQLDRDATYEWYKDRVEDRVEDTCLWFINHPNFKSWLEQDFGPLFVSADPGCGKSVLAKYLVDHYLPYSAPSSMVCYFFFKDQDQNTVRQALCALLHQILSRKPSLIKHAVDQYKHDGDGLINSTTSLWNVLGNVTQDPEAGSVIIVLDALDECDEKQFKDLVRNVDRQFRTGWLASGKLKYLLTSRPYDQIVSELNGFIDNFPHIRIPGEEHSDDISQEISRVISHRVQQLSAKKRFSKNVGEQLEETLQKTTHRTYLWVYLVFEYLEGESLKKTPGAVLSAIEKLPKSVNQAYEQILNKSKDRSDARKALCIILAAARPLTLAEMNVAMEVGESTKSIDDLDLETEIDFILRLRSLCGLFISTHHGKIYLLHQTAREFLFSDLATTATSSSELQWQHSISARYAHRVFAEVCVHYLDLFDFKVSTEAWNFYNAFRHTPAFSYCSEVKSAYDKAHLLYKLLEYAAEFWPNHFRLAEFGEDAAIIPIALRICDSTSDRFLSWFPTYTRSDRESLGHSPTYTMMASCFGHQAIVQRMISLGDSIDTKHHFGKTPLWIASQNGHEYIARLLIGVGASVNTANYSGITPLWIASREGHESIARMLIGAGAPVDIADHSGNTPLWIASHNGHESIARLLIGAGASVYIANMQGATPLWIASCYGYESIARLLIGVGASVDITDNGGITPLWIASRNGHESIARLLIGVGASVDIADYGGTTPLWIASQKGHESIARLLIRAGSSVNTADNEGRTALYMAAWSSHEDIIRLLISAGASVNKADKDGGTPLSKVVPGYRNYESVTRLLINEGASTETEILGGRDTTLSGDKEERWLEWLT